MSVNSTKYNAQVGTYSSGATITHTLFNTEFSAIANAFHASTGHNHDGTTAGAGAPISTLYSNSISIGTNTDSDITLTFNANSNDGVLKWMEDEDYFEFSDGVKFTNKTVFDAVSPTSAGAFTVAIPLTTSTVFLNTSSSVFTGTLAAGIDGQRITITLETAGNNAVLTATNCNLSTDQVANQITLNSVGDSVQLTYSATLSKWLVVGGIGYAIS